MRLGLVVNVPVSITPPNATDVLETIAEPDVIYEGNAGEKIAAREVEIGKFLLVVYREVNNEDEFVITSFLTKRIKQLEQRKKLWLS